MKTLEDERPLETLRMSDMKGRRRKEGLEDNRARFYRQRGADAITLAAGG